jgi:DNA-binding transcriptional ArsR family regulator
VEAAVSSTDAVVPRVDLVDPRLAAAMSHPTRIGVMGVLVEGPASPRQLAAELGEPLSNVTYHVNQLRDLGCIELDRTERRAGGRVLERFYRAGHRVYFDDAAWGVLSDKQRLGVVWSTIGMISKDISAAIAAGTFFGDHCIQLCRTPMTLDEEGWQEVVELLSRATEELFEIEERVDERREEGATSPSIHTKVELMQFRSPPPVAEPG